jgi:predicted RNA binding protein YcfA (HicA-like mRNA interferase family)
LSKLPVVSGRQAVKAFGKDGWVVVRRKGSHIALEKAAYPLTLAIPDHRELDRGTLRSLIKASGLTVDELVHLL